MTPLASSWKITHQKNFCTPQGAEESFELKGEEDD
jgi:hypothetical protein